MSSKCISLVIISCISVAFIGLLLPNLGIYLFKKSNGDKCKVPAECDETLGLSCRRNLASIFSLSCECSQSNFWSKEINTCANKILINKPCSDTHPCSDGLTCRENLCQCSNIDEYWLNSKCVAKKLNEEQCLSSDECSSGHGLDCLDFMCKCSEDYKYYAGGVGCVVGVATDIATASLISDGFNLIYQKPYSWVTTSKEIQAIRSECRFDSFLCVAGANQDGANLITVACANCLHVTGETEKNKPLLGGKVWWYNTVSASFGYSPTEELRQNAGDASSKQGGWRLSWHLTGDGGWRAGNEQYLSKNEVILKYVFVKHN